VCVEILSVIKIPKKNMLNLTLLCPVTKDKERFQEGFEKVENSWLRAEVRLIKTILVL
jgi:hypothetical protein